ncbi:MAG: MFS transporter [Anaerolineales bacterium]
MKNATGNPMLRVFSIRNFCLLWFGSSISILGSQFSLIALPWLVLQLTGDPLALGIVLALGGIPRALFMLVGGAIVDRFSPRITLLICDWVNFVMTGLIAALVFTGFMQVWMIYIFSLITGLVSGFVIPASNSIVPFLVAEEDLQAGNSISAGSSQLAQLIGPALAGIIIGAYSQSTFGIVIAFLLDSLTFVVSAVALMMMHTGHKQISDAAKPRETIWASIRLAFAYLWEHTGLKFMFIVMALANFLFVGPLLVGIPVLADQRLPEGARAFGFLMSAYAGGNLAGFILGGVLPKPSGRGLSIFVVSLLAAFGVVLVNLGWITLTWVDFLLILALGIGNGYISLIIFTWMQQRTPREMLGRIMSIVMLASMGLVPLSQAISGAIIRWSLSGLFAISGGLMLLAACWAALQPALRLLSSEMVDNKELQKQNTA